MVVTCSLGNDRIAAESARQQKNDSQHSSFSLFFLYLAGILAKAKKLGRFIPALAIVSGSIVCLEVSAQSTAGAPIGIGSTCTAYTTGTNLFTASFGGTFGTGAGAGETSNRLSGAQSGFTYINYGNASPNDGFMSFTTETTVITFNAWHIGASGSTTFTTDDYFMVINAGNGAGRIIWGSSVFAIPAGAANIEIELDLMNIVDLDLRAIGEPNVDIFVNRIGIDDDNDTFTDEAGDGLLLGQSGDIPATSSPVWRNFSAAFDTLGSTQAEVFIRNNSNVVSGNDIALDGVSARACVTPVQQIPTLSEWMLIMLASILLLAGYREFLRLSKQNTKGF